MSDTHTGRDELPERANEPPESVIDTDRYAQLTLEDGAVVIYDREEPETWLQSDVVVEVGA